MYNWRTIFTSIEDYVDIKELSCVYILLFEKDYYYIGSTKDLQERLKKHTNTLSRNGHDNPFMQNVFNADHFIVDIRILEVDPENRLIFEDYLIQKCFPDEKCCNINDSAFRPPVCTKEIHQYSIEGDYIQSWNSVTEAAKHIKCSGSQLSDVANGNNQSAKGFRWSYVKQDKLPEIKYSDFSYGIFDNWICQYTLDGHFVQKHKNIKEASKATGSTYITGILVCFDNFEHIIRGFRWQRIKKTDSIPEYIPVKIPAFHKKVVQLTKTGEVIKVWNNAKEAALTLNFKRQDHIHRACSGKRETFMGFKWQYE